MNFCESLLCSLALSEAPQEADGLARRGGGGPWRAFVHIQCRKQKWGARGTATLSEQYHRLSPNSKAWYIDAGRAASAAHRSGGSSFPCYSATATHARHAMTKPENIGSGSVAPNLDDPQQQLKAAKREARRQRALRKEEHVQRCEDLMLYAKETTQHILQSQQLLKGLEFPSFFAFPHQFDALQTSVQMKQMSTATLEGLGSLDYLKRAWDEQHLGVRPSSSQAIPPIPASRCWRLRTCMCSLASRRLRQFIQAATLAWKRLVKQAKLEEQLLIGNVIIKWTSHLEPTQQDAIIDVHYTHVPLHHRSPWRPCLLALEKVAEATPTQSAEFVALREGRLGGGDHFVLQHLETFLQSLQLAPCWRMTLLTLSSRHRPCRAVQGQVYADEHADHTTCFWRGTAHAKPRKQRRQSILAALNFIEDMPDQEQPDNTATQPAGPSADIPDSAAEMVLPNEPEYTDDVLPHEEAMCEEEAEEYFSEAEETLLQQLCGKGALQAARDGLEAQTAVPGPVEQPSGSTLQQSAPECLASSSDTSSSSSTSSSTSSDHEQAGGSSAKPKRKPVGDNEPASFAKLKPYTLLKKFRLTPKAPEELGGTGGMYGGYSALCPYHRKSAQTQCKKWSPLLGGLELHRKQALARLIVWLLEGPAHSRQRTHVGSPLVANADDLPSVSELHRRVREITLPTTKVADDRQLDQQEGVDPDQAPRRVKVRRLKR